MRTSYLVSPLVRLRGRLLDIIRGPKCRYGNRGHITYNYDGKAYCQCPKCQGYPAG